MGKKDSLPAKTKTNKTGEPQKKKFKLSRQQLQGAGAMLLVCVLVVTLVVTSGKADFLLGTTFEDQEDVVENVVVVEPSTIDAEKDYKGQTFTIIGLPEADLANIKAEHISFGGYLANLKPESLEVADGSLMVQAIKDEAVTEDWTEYEGDSGFIAISQDAFTDQVSYQGEVAVTYPQLTTSVEAIAQAADFSIAQEVSFTLENDQFAGDVTAADVTVTGGMTNITIDNFRQAGNVCSFTLNGIGDGKFSEAQFAISGEKLAKGIPLKTSIGIGRVPKAEQASALYLNNSAEQKLTVHLEYDTFTPAIDASMLTFNGSMSEFSLTGLKLVDDFTLELTLTGGPSQPGTGSIVFDSAAVESGRTGREALMTIEDQNAPASVQEAPLSAAPSSVEGKIPGLGFLCELAWDYTSALVRENASTSRFFSQIGMRPKERETTKMLKEISGQIESLSGQIKNSTYEIKNRLNISTYNQIATDEIGSELKELEAVYASFSDALTREETNPGAFETWASENMTYTMNDSCSANQYMVNLKKVTEKLGYNYSTKHSSNVYTAYENICKGQLPFEHNIFMEMASYLWEWDAEVAKYMTVATAIVDYNAELEKPVNDKMMGVFATLSSTLNTTFTALDEHVKSGSYYSAYNQLVVPRRSDQNKLFYVVDAKNGNKYLIADSLNNSYQVNAGGRRPKSVPATEPGSSTSKGFLAHFQYAPADIGRSYFALNPAESFNNMEFEVETAKNASTITAPKKVTSFIQSISNSKMTLQSVFDLYLVEFNDTREENGEIEAVKLLDRPYQWMYGAVTTDYIKFGYYNDRTLMIDTNTFDGGYEARSVTCEDGLFNNDAKFGIKKDDNILILLTKKD